MLLRNNKGCSISSTMSYSLFFPKEKEFHHSKMTFFLRSLVYIFLSTTLLLSNTNGQWQAFPRLPNTEKLWMPNMPATRGAKTAFHSSVQQKVSQALPTGTSRPFKEQYANADLPQSSANLGSKSQRSRSESSRQSRQRPSESMTRSNNNNKVPRSNRHPVPTNYNHKPHNRMGNSYALPPPPRNYGIPSQQSNHKHRMYSRQNYKKMGPVQTQSSQNAVWHDFPPQKSRNMQAATSSRIENRIPPPQYKSSAKKQVQVPLNPDRAVKWPNLPREPLFQQPAANQLIITLNKTPTISTTTTPATPAPTPAIQEQREPRPVSQHPGQLHDSWPNTNVHHHLAPVGVTPTAQPTTSTASSPPSKIKISNEQHVLSSTTKRSVFDSPSPGYSSSLSQTQKEKILQMTNTLTKLSPKKPIHVFMKLEGIKLTEQGADVGEVIKKYAGSSKVPFFNGTLPMNQIPTVFLAPEDMTPPNGYGKIPIPTLKKPSNNGFANNKFRGAGHSSYDLSPTSTAKPASFSVTYLPQSNHIKSSTEKQSWKDWSTPGPIKFSTPSTTLSPPTEKLRFKTPSPTMAPPMPPYSMATSATPRSSQPYPNMQVATSRSSEAFPHVDTPTRNPFIASATTATPPGYTKVLLPPGASGSQLSPEQAQKLAQNPNTKTLNNLTNEQKIKIINLLKKSQAQVYNGPNKPMPPVQQQQQQRQQQQQYNQNSQVFVDQRQQNNKNSQVFVDQRQQNNNKNPGGEKEVKYKTGYKVIQAPANIDTNDPDPYAFLKGVLPEGAIVESISPLKGGGLGGVELDSLPEGSVSIPSRVAAPGNAFNSQQLKAASIPQFQAPQQQGSKMVPQQHQQQQGQRPPNSFIQPHHQQQVFQQQPHPQQQMFQQHNPMQQNSFQQHNPNMQQNFQQQNTVQQNSFRQPNPVQQNPQIPSQQHPTMFQQNPPQHGFPPTFQQNQFLQQQAQQFRPPQQQPPHLQAQGTPSPKIVINPGIQINIPKPNEPILDKNELTQILGAIVKTDTPRTNPSLQQQQQQLPRQPLLQQGPQMIPNPNVQIPNGNPNWQQQNRPLLPQQLQQPSQNQQFNQQVHLSQNIQPSIQLPTNQFNQRGQIPQQNQFQQQSNSLQQLPQHNQFQQQGNQQPQINPTPHQFQQQNPMQFQQQQQFNQQNQQLPQQNQFNQQQFPYQNPFPPIPNSYRPSPGPILGAPQTIVFSQNNPKQPTFSQPVAAQNPQPVQVAPNINTPQQQPFQQQPRPQGPAPTTGNQQEQQPTNRLPVLIPAPPPSTTKPPPPTRPPPPPPTRPPPPPPTRPPPPKEQPQRPPPTGKPRNPLKSALSFLGIQSTSKPDLVVGKPGPMKPNPSHLPPPPERKDKQQTSNQIDDDDDSDSRSSESSQHEYVIRPPPQNKDQKQQTIGSNNVENPTILIRGDGSNIPDIKSIISSLNNLQQGEKVSGGEDNSDEFTVYKSTARPPVQQQHIFQSTPQPPFIHPSPTPTGPPLVYHHQHGLSTAAPNPFISHVGSTGRPVSSPILSPSPPPGGFFSSSPSPLLVSSTGRPMLISPTGTPGQFVVTNQSPAPLVLQTNTASKQFYPSSTTPTPATQQFIVQTPSGPPQIITMNANVSPAALHLAAVQSVIRQNLGLNLGPTGAPILINPSGSPGGNTATILNGNGGTVTPVSPSGATIVLTSNTLPSTTITETFPVKSPETEDDVQNSNKVSSSERKYASKEELLKLLSPSTPPATSSESTTLISEKKASSGERQENDRVRFHEPSDDDRVIEKVRTEEKIVWDGPTPSKIRTEERTIIRPNDKKYSSERESLESIRSENRVVVKGQSQETSDVKVEELAKTKEEFESFDSPSTSSPTSFANLLASKMRFDTLKEKLYPQKNFLGSTNDHQHQYYFQPLAPSIPREQQQRYPEHDLVYLPDGRLTFVPSSTNPPFPYHSSSESSSTLKPTDEESFAHETVSSTVEPTVPTTTAYDVNGRFKIRPGDLSKHENMTPLFSITPSSLDTRFHDHNQYEEQPKLEHAYLSSSTTPPNEEIPSTSDYAYVSGGSANPNNYYNEDSSRSTTEIPYGGSSSKSGPTSEEKLMFFPSSTASTSFGFSEAVGDPQDGVQDERLIFFPSSTSSPFDQSEQEPVLQWEPIHQNKNVSETTQRQENVEAITVTEPVVPTTTEEIVSSSTSTSPSTTTEPPTEYSSTTTEQTTTTTTTEATERNYSDDKPITWRPTKSPSNPVLYNEPEPATFITSAERALVSNVGANSLHAVMAGLPHQSQHNWQDSSFGSNKDIGASVLYAVANGGAAPGVQMHHHGAGPPGLVPVAQYHHHTMLVTPGLMPSTPELFSVTPSYYKPSPTEKNYYDHWYGTAGITHNDPNDEREKYEIIEEPSTTTRTDRLRYRSKYRIPPGTTVENDGDGKKLIPIYVQKNALRRQRFRVKPSTTTTPLPLVDDEELPSSEYDDEGLPLKDPNHYYDEPIGPEDQFRRKPQKTIRPEDIDDTHPAFNPKPYRKKHPRLPEKKVRIPEDNYNERRPLLRRRKPTTLTTITTTTTTTPRPFYDDDTSEETAEEFSKPVTSAPEPPPPTRRRKVNKYASSETDELYDDYDLKPMFHVDYKLRKRPRTTTTTEATTQATTTTTTPRTTTTPSTTTTQPTTTETEPPVPVTKRRKGLRRRTTTTTTTTTTTQVPEPEYDSSSEEISEERQTQQNITTGSQSTAQPNLQVPNQQPVQTDQSQLEITGNGEDQNSNYIQPSATSQESIYQPNEGLDNSQQFSQMVDLSSLEVQQQQPQTDGTTGNEGQTQYMNNAGFQNNGAEINTQQNAGSQQQSSTLQQNVESPATIMIHGFQPILTQILPHRPQQFGSLSTPQQQNEPQSQFHNRILQNGQFANSPFQQQQYFQNNLLNSMQQQQFQQQNAGGDQSFFNSPGYYPNQVMPTANIYQTQPIMQNFNNNHGFNQHESIQGNYFQNSMNNAQQPTTADNSQSILQNQYSDITPLDSQAETNEESFSEPTVTFSVSTSTSTNVVAPNRTQPIIEKKEKLESNKKQEEEIEKVSTDDIPQQVEVEKVQDKLEVLPHDLEEENVPKSDHVNHDLFMMSGESENSEEEEEREHKAKFISSEAKDPFVKTAGGISTYTGNNGAGGSHIGLLSQKLAGMSLLTKDNTKIKDTVIPNLMSDTKSVVKKTGFVNEEPVVDPVTLPTSTSTATTKPITTTTTTTTTEKPSSTSSATTVTPIRSKLNISTTAVGSAEDYDLHDLKQLLKKLSSRLSESEELYDYYNDPSSIELLRTKAKTTTTTVKPKKSSKAKSGAKNKKKSKKTPTKNKKKSKDSKGTPTTKKPKANPKITSTTIKPKSKTTKAPKLKKVSTTKSTPTSTSTKAPPKKALTTKAPPKKILTRTPPKKILTSRSTTTTTTTTTTETPVTQPPTTTTKPINRKLKPKFTIGPKSTTTTIPFTRKTMKPISYVLPQQLQSQSLVKETTTITTTSAPTTTVMTSTDSFWPPSNTTVHSKIDSLLKRPNKIGLPQKPLWVRRRLLRTNETSSIASNESVAPPSGESKFNPSVRLADLNNNGNRRAKIRVIRRRRPNSSANSGTYEQVSLENVSSNSGVQTTQISNLPLENIFQSNLLKRTGVALGDNNSESNNSSSTSGRRKLKLVRTGDRAQWKLTDQNYSSNNNPNEQYYDSRQQQGDFYSSYNFNPYNTYLSSEQQQQQYQNNNPIVEPMPLTGTTTLDPLLLLHQQSPSSASVEQQQESSSAELSAAVAIPGSVNEPKKQIRMESSLSVETTVCVRGKCEIVTKN